MTRGWRRVFASLNLVTTLLLLLALFIFVNFIASRRYARWDTSKQKITALSDQTVQTLKTLMEPVSVIVFYQPGHRLFELVNDLLAEYSRTSPHVRVERVDPEQDVARARQLVQAFEIDVTNPEALNLVIFKAGTRHKYLSDTDLAEYDYSSMAMGGGPRVKSFKGEEAFTSALISVTQGQAPLTWITSGHGEKSIAAADPTGLAELKKYLEQQNLSVEAVTLLEKSNIPSDVTLVVIPGPTRRFTEVEVGVLEAYLRQGGRVLLLIDPLEETGLDGLCARWGMEVGMDIVVDPSRRLPFVSAANLFVTDYTEHPIVKKMKTLMTLFPLARSVRPAEPAPASLTVTPLAMTSEAGWGETQTSVERFQFDEGQDIEGPVSIAVASERLSAAPAAQAAGQPTSPTLTPAASTAAPTRFVVIGDSDFIANAQLGNVGNRDFLLGAVYWLIEQERRIGISPKTIASMKLHLTGGQMTGISLFSFLALPSLFGLLGVGMWLLRRH